MAFTSLPENDCPDGDPFEYIQFLTCQISASCIQEELPSLILCVVIFLISSWDLFRSIVHASSAFEYRVGLKQCHGFTISPGV